MADRVDPWRSELRQARDALALSRRELARLSRVSEAAIKSYESGERHPSRAHLVDLLDALKVDRGTRNDILADAGFMPDGMALRYDMDALAFTVREAETELERYAWPAFLADEFGRVLCANRVAQRLWGVDLDREFTHPLDRHLISVATNPRFADRCLNWDEAVGTILAVFRDHRRGGESFDEPSPMFAELVQRLTSGDPRYVGRLAELWQSAPAIKVKMRWSYPVVWQTSEGSPHMSFQCFLSAANERDGYMFHDWIPTDAGTWTALTDLSGGS